jgi:hypothetical protein
MIGAWHAQFGELPCRITKPLRFSYYFWSRSRAPRKHPAIPWRRSAGSKTWRGSCWSGSNEDGKTLDTQCYSVQFGRFLRGTINLSGRHGNQPANPDSPGATRFVWNRIDADSFVVTREKRQGKAWSKVLEVRYRRGAAK